MQYDVVIVGGGPAGLSAALALGRARRKVLLCDAGPRRNALAQHIHNFVTRDGTTPAQFRQSAREQLARYPNVESRDHHVDAISGARGAFSVRCGPDVLGARRVILCMGMIDEALPIDGFAELWGRAIFQCPYCHGWEVAGRPWGYLAPAAATATFAILLRSWSERVTLFTQGAFELEPEVRAQLDAARVRVSTEPIARLRRRDHELDGVELADGDVVPCEALFTHPPQRQVALVTALGLELDAEGFVRVDPMTRETSVPGVYAAGDLTSRMQGAILAAATGVQAAGMLVHALIGELVRDRALGAADGF